MYTNTLMYTNTNSQVGSRSSPDLRRLLKLLQQRQLTPAIVSSQLVESGATPL